MIFRTLGISLLFLSVVSFAQGRKPAVEDFVGIEVDEPQVTPQGTEPLFNLEQDLTKHTEEKKNNPAEIPTTAPATPSNWGIFSILSLTMVMGMPLIVWFMIMSHMRRKASLESASNIEVLERYRKEREQNKKSKEDIRKAS